MQIRVHAVELLLPAVCLYTQREISCRITWRQSDGAGNGETDRDYGLPFEMVGACAAFFNINFTIACRNRNIFPDRLAISDGRTDFKP